MNDDLLISSPPTPPGHHWWWHGTIICLAAILFGDFLAIVMEAIGVPLVLVDMLRIAGAAAFLLIFRQMHPDEPLLGRLYLRHLLVFGVLSLFIKMFWTFGLVVPGFECLENRYSFSKLYFFWVAVVVAPIVEEVFFRHFFLRAFPYARSTGWTIVAVAVTSVFFSVVHLQYTCSVSFVSLFLLGVVYAYARIVSGGLLLPILLHAAYNATSFI